MKLICGLGNPGRDYEDTRHNVGFRVVERLVDRARASYGPAKFEAKVAQGTLGGDKVLFVLPQTFMNLSGRSVAGAARFFKVEPADVLVIHDELDLPFGRLQLKGGGGVAGHNGLRSILAEWGEEGFARLRVGIGKPDTAGAKQRVVGHVLSGFSAEEAAELGGLLDRAADAAQTWATEGLAKAMNRHNRPASPAKPAG